MSFGCKWPSGTPDRSLQLTIRLSFTLVKTEQSQRCRMVGGDRKNGWTSLTIYGTNGLVWSPEMRLDCSDFVQYKRFEMVTRQAAGLVWYCTVQMVWCGDQSSGWTGLTMWFFDLETLGRGKTNRIKLVVNLAIVLRTSLLMNSTQTKERKFTGVMKEMKKRVWSEHK
jgi:hypothetical protein